jgi:hypothetical protein
MPNRYYSLLIALLLTSCGAMNQALTEQDHANAGLTRPSSSSSIRVQRSLDLSFVRGAISTTFTATLPAGSYQPIASSNNGTFYLAPFGGFSYAVGGEVTSRVGGIFTPSSGRPQVWFFDQAQSQGQWQIIRSGIWISSARGGLMTVRTRPWVEKQFDIPTSAIGR